MFTKYHYQGKTEKEAAVQTKNDSVYETLTNKSLVSPIINDATAVNAYVEVAVTDAAQPIRIIANAPGTAANSYTLTIEATEDPTDLDVLWGSPDMSIKVLKDSEGNILTTAYEFARLCANDTDFTGTFTVTWRDGTLITEGTEGDKIVEIMTQTSLAHGAGGVALTSNSTEIDDTVDAVASYTPTGADLGTDVGTLWTDVETTTTGLKDRMTAAEGDIDDLEAVASSASTYVAAVASSKVLTVDGTPAEGDSVTIGGTQYKFRLDALSETGVQATGTLDLTAEAPHDGDTVQLGLVTYTFKTALTPTAGEVLIDGSSANAIDNLILAMTTGAGGGTKYATGTTPSPNVTGVRSSDTMVTTYVNYGTLGNSFDTLGTMTHGSWGAVTLTGGVEPRASGDVFVNGSATNAIINLEKAIEASGSNGTDYYLDPHTAHATVEVSAKDASTVTVSAKTKGVAGDLIALAKSGTNLSWAGGATFLSGGVNGTVAETGKILIDAGASKVYFCTDGDHCTISDSTGWKYASLT